ncbi:glycosyltransferase family 4 protein [Flavobacterium sp. 11]|uniref:glycosyltransferase family 4 protein n=1 Tax=Flavobacterium sp. 11 TaxID=357523 RepID=UPI000C19B9B8|nr:glycosyltransferase family 4 protein [Flavobacterium sp. 11]PIF60664.1 glycosyltransferase involved in cell wall biosynthesis [Flavobacterium sp. 11]
MKSKNKLIRITTVPVSLKTLLKGQHQFMSNHYEVVGISSEGQELRDVKNQEGIRVIPIEMTRTISLLKDFKSLWELYKILKKEKPLIVHSHTPKAGIVGMLAAKLAGVPYRLHTVAGLPLMEATGSKRKLLDFVEQLTYNCATKVYPNSKVLSDFILKNNFTKPDKLKVIANGSSNGINTSHFDSAMFSATDLQTLKDNLGITKHNFVFVFVGRLVSDKGINELVQAFEKLSKQSIDVKLLLVGSLESDLDPLQLQTLHEIKYNANIISVGFQKDVRPYFSISNTLVFPSYREGFPNVVMQAGAMGLPSIVTNINGCNEIVEEGINGIIIPVKDSDAIYSAMQKMISDNYFRTQLQKKARAMIVSRYEQRVVWEAILAEYKSLEQNV